LAFVADAVPRFSTFLAKILLRRLIFGSPVPGYMACEREERFEEEQFTMLAIDAERGLT
jgi:hypothetical protein